MLCFICGYPTMAMHTRLMWLLVAACCPSVQHEPWVHVFFSFLFKYLAVGILDVSTPLTLSCCRSYVFSVSFVLQRCRGNLETVAIGWLNEGARRWCDDGSGSELCQRRYLGLPRFRALPAGGKTHTFPTMVTMFLELFGLEEEEEDRIPLV
jgi:hypothetical protein